MTSEKDTKDISKAELLLNNMLKMKMKYPVDITTLLKVWSLVSMQYTSERNKQELQAFTNEIKDLRKYR